jgi:hypothetical protein
VDLELEQRQALGFADSICTDCVSMVTMQREGNLTGCALGQIGRSWFGNYGPDYFKDCPSALGVWLSAAVTLSASWPGKSPTAGVISLSAAVTGPIPFL